MDVSTLCRIRRRFPSPVFERHCKCTWRQTSMKCSKTLNNFEFRICYLTCILCLLILRRLANKKADWTDWISEALQPEFGDVKLLQRRFNFHRTCQMFPSKYHLQYYDAMYHLCSQVPGTAETATVEKSLEANVVVFFLGHGCVFSETHLFLDRMLLSCYESRSQNDLSPTGFKDCVN